MRPRQGERGYASLAAIAAIAVFAVIAVGQLERSRGSLSIVSAEIGRAKAEAAADAGFAIALNGLLAADRASRWSIDGRVRRMAFEDTVLSIRVEDERGKVPLNLLDDEFADGLLYVLGLQSGERAAIARDSLLDWVDEDEEPRPEGAEADYYARKGLRIRNGPPQSVDELANVRGFDKALIDRMRPFVTVHFGTGSFDARFAQPDAIAVMQGGGLASPAAIERQRELEGQRVAIELGDDFSLVGRPLSITIEARRNDGTRVSRRTIVELTGAKDRPFIVKAYE